MPKQKPHKEINKKRVNFTLEAPNAKEVVLMGHFNNWSDKTHIMKKTEKGSWSKIIMLPPGRYEYKFLVDGQWYNDPKNEQTVLNCFGTFNNIIAT